MPVAYSQTCELYALFRRYLSLPDLRHLLAEAQQTEAYQRNASFRETIQRLIALTEERDAT